MTKNIRYILTEYVERTLKLASYDSLEDGTFAGNIQQCPGVIAFGKTLHECQSNLRSTLEEWILLGLRLGHRLPRIAGIDLNRDTEVRKRRTESAERKRKSSVKA